MDAEIKVVKNEETKERGYFDFSLLFLALILIAFGVVMIYSASSYNATKYYSDPMYFARSQIKNIIFGLIAMFAVAVVPYRFYRFGGDLPSWLALLGCTLLTGIVLVVGKSTNGSARWLQLAGKSLQPAELCKFAAILFASYGVSSAPKKLQHWYGPIKIFVWSSFMIVLVAVENLSSAIIIAAIVGVICFAGSEKRLYYLFYLLAGVGAVVLFIMSKGYRSDRIDIWLNVETNAKGGQILQGLYAIASAGAFGSGLGNSMQKMGHIPEAHNDMIFSIICEEIGIVGVTILIAFYILLLWRIYVVAVNANELYESMLCVGVMTNIAVQLILNIAVVTNTIPSTGISLPFISYGGSSMLVLCAEIGLVLGVSSRIRYERVEE